MTDHEKSKPKIHDRKSPEMKCVGGVLRSPEQVTSEQVYCFQQGQEIFSINIHCSYGVGYGVIMTKFLFPIHTTKTRKRSFTDTMRVLPSLLFSAPKFLAPESSNLRE